jgi:SsrA-binding protein
MSSVNIENRKAYYDYFVLETLECGIELKGHEVKSIRKGSCNLKDSYCQIEKGELILLNAHISKFDKAMDYDIAERRPRRLLAHKQEIRSFERKLIDNGITLIPLKMYMTEGKVKVLVGLCKGKHNYDKRQSIKERDLKRELSRY